MKSETLPAAADMNRGALSLGAAVLVIIALNAAIYGWAGSADFINWDDDVYVAQNPIVAQGLSAEGWRHAWALDTPPYYMPLTWLSFLVNAELWGLDAGAFHLANVALHIASAVLLFLCLRLATGETARSLLVAALFSVHPLHVEGVMWIAQRKEMLSAFFGLCALFAYTVYARRADDGRAARTWYLAMLLALVCSLLSKPMWLTAPALLLLLDVWPLRRTRIGAVRLLREKAPVLAICVLLLGVNVAVFDWDANQLMESMDVTPFAAGWGTVPISYAVFLWKTFVPHPLAVPYTAFQQAPSAGAVAVSIGVLVALSAVAVQVRHRAPWFTVGWLWFLVSAATVLFSFGSGKVTPLADHWTYVPHIGLFAAIAWCLPLGPGREARTRSFAAAGCLLAVAVLGAMAYTQTRHWQNPPSLWSHSVAVTDGNHIAYWLWGLHEWQAGRHAEGERLMRRAQALNPGEPFYVHQFANLLLEAGRGDKALAEYRRLLDASLARPDTLTTVGITALRALGPAEAEPFLRRAARLEEGPDSHAARFYLWLALAAQGHTDEADAVLKRIIAAQETGRTDLCRQADVTVRRLARVDARWTRYIPAIDAYCASGP